MKRNNKKGFTIIELVVVIAVIAILAAVLIPTFSSIIKKANTSADTQAVNTMNKYLAIEEVTGNKTIVDVYAALKEGGMTAKDYKPLATDTCFFWDRTLNRIVYTDKEFNVIYPTDLNATKNNGWYSLSGVIDEKSVTPSTSTDNNVTTTTYTVKTAEEFYWLANQINDGKVATTNLVIKLDADEIDLMGANVSIDLGKNDDSVIKSVTIEGKDDNAKTTIKGLAAVNPAYYRKDNNYNIGLFSRVWGDQVTVNIKNLIIKDASVGDCEVSSVGILVGAVYNGATLNISNCEISGGDVYAKCKVGALVGQVQGGYGKNGGENNDNSGKTLVSISGCAVNNVDIYVTEGECGYDIGVIFNRADVTLDKKFSDWTNGCTINLGKGEIARVQYNASDISISLTDNTAQLPANAKLIEGKKYNGISQGYYKVYTDDTYANILYHMGNFRHGSTDKYYNNRCNVKYGSEGSWAYYAKSDEEEGGSTKEATVKSNNTTIEIFTIYKYITE